MLYSDQQLMTQSAAPMQKLIHRRRFNLQLNFTPCKPNPVKCVNSNTQVPVLPY